MPTAPPAVEPGDEELVRRHKAGDEGAFPELARRYARPLLGFLQGCIRDRGRAEELAQDVLVSAHRALPRYRHSSSFAAWLFRIARNAALNALRARRREERALRALSPRREEDPEAAAEARERGELVRSAVARLPPRLRDAVLLRDMEGLSLREAARALGIREKALSARLARGRARLREMLRGLEPPAEPRR